MGTNTEIEKRAIHCKMASSSTQEQQQEEDASELQFPKGECLYN